MSVETLQNIRFLIIYPLLSVTGAAWAWLSWMRWRQYGMAGDFWSAQIAMGLAVWGLLALVALWLAGRTGFSYTTSLLTTIGGGLTAAALTAAVVVSLARAWRRDS